ncbi:hypothetical protein NX02_00150 [Sphingomonas sanxanigenens DSM 19645 = NX02]|uniref:Uncharacterized protein n=2 Tax=Sphingomonas sanxanigenens TaxID=397260 RepID=W0A1I4_9SPHN|nr:hypothetical protein NX02_00150 [Sphingomonas sanxanigenens DSM 19645 = NX02]
MALALLVAAPQTAQAYLGPGLGMGAIGVALGVVGSVFMGILAVVWYPIKRLLRRLRGRSAAAPTPEDAGTD